MAARGAAPAGSTPAHSAAQHRNRRTGHCHRHDRVLICWTGEGGTGVDPAGLEALPGLFVAAPINWPLDSLAG